MVISNTSRSEAEDVWHEIRTWINDKNVGDYKEEIVTAIAAKIEAAFQDGQRANNTWNFLADIQRKEKAGLL